MKRLKLTKGRTTVLDDVDFARFSQWKWHYVGSGYAARSVNSGHRRKMIYLHREILGVKKGEYTDHVDGRRLNNRRSNLRVATNAENAFNRGAQKNSKTRVKGVTKEKRKLRKPWVVQVSAFGKRVFFGRFRTLKEAQAAQRTASRKFHGKFFRDARELCAWGPST